MLGTVPRHSIRNHLLSSTLTLSSARRFPNGLTHRAEATPNSHILFWMERPLSVVCVLCVCVVCAVCCVCCVCAVCCAVRCALCAVRCALCAVRCALCGAVLCVAVRCCALLCVAVRCCVKNNTAHSFSLEPNKVSQDDQVPHTQDLTERKQKQPKNDTGSVRACVETQTFPEKSYQLPSVQASSEQHGKDWGLLVTFARYLPCCPCSPLLLRACHRHGDWAITAWLAQAADSLKVTILSVTPLCCSECRAKSPTENRTTKNRTVKRQEADTQTPSILCMFAESYSPLWASTASHQRTHCTCCCFHPQMH